MVPACTFTIFPAAKLAPQLLKVPVVTSASQGMTPKVAVAMGADYKTVIYPLDGGEALPVPGLEAGEVPAGWGPDGTSLICQRIGQLPITIFRVELATGKRTPLKQTSPPDPVGIASFGAVYLSADLKSYVYTVDRRLDVLYLVDGIR